MKTGKDHLLYVSYLTALLVICTVASYVLPMIH
jgi:hypothetical protein